MTARIRIHRRHDHTAALARELEEFRTQADLHELAAVLDRHDDAEAESLRTLVDWTRAA